MKDQELIEKLKSDIVDWEEQARLWDSKGEPNFASQCRTKAEQWSDVIRYLEAKEHA